MARRLTGKKASFTWTPGGGDSINVAEGHAWTLQYDKNGAAKTTPFNWVMDRYDIDDVIDGQGTLDVFATDDAAPAMPSGTIGTLVLYTRTPATAKLFTFAAKIVQVQVLNVRSNTSVSPIVIRYSFVVSADDNNDTLTIA